MAKQKEQLYVRLKPYNRALGHLRISHTVGGLRFVGGPDPQWVMVTEKQADYCREKRQDNNSPQSPPLFDVCTEAEMKKLQARETRSRLGLRSDEDLAALLRLEEAQDATPTTPISFKGAQVVDPMEPKGKTAPHSRGDLSPRDIERGTTNPRDVAPPSPPPPAPKPQPPASEAPAPAPAKRTSADRKGKK